MESVLLWGPFQRCVRFARVPFVESPHADSAGNVVLLEGQF